MNDGISRAKSKSVSYRDTEETENKNLKEDSEPLDEDQEESSQQSSEEKSDLDKKEKAFDDDKNEEKRESFLMGTGKSVSGLFQKSMPYSCTDYEAGKKADNRGEAAIDINKKDAKGEYRDGINAMFRSQFNILSNGMEQLRARSGPDRHRPPEYERTRESDIIKGEVAKANKKDGDERRKHEEDIKKKDKDREEKTELRNKKIKENIDRIKRKMKEEKRHEEEEIENESIRSQDEDLAKDVKRTNTQMIAQQQRVAKNDSNKWKNVINSEVVRDFKKTLSQNKSQEAKPISMVGRSVSRIGRSSV